MTQPLTVPPGTKVNLKEFDARYVADGISKSDGKKELDANVRQLSDLGYRLYAENHRALLLVLQGMDTSGKDGTIRSMMKGLNPQSC